ncbi:hypothetical protein QK309_26170, partial [Klebsiella quasipneumoniae]|uniref:hypothetical protein n=1 Tax=Klebsiella quasipneumoniae TaxID=1463165 RepID=UPI00249CCCAB
MNQKNSGVKIKKVSFDWKEVNKSELTISYRVSCKVTTDNGLEVEGSHFYKWSKPGADLSFPFNYGDAETNAGECKKICVTGILTTLLKGQQNAIIRRTH